MMEIPGVSPLEQAQMLVSGAELAYGHTLNNLRHLVEQVASDEESIAIMSARPDIAWDHSVYAEAEERITNAQEGLPILFASGVNAYKEVIRARSALAQSIISEADTDI